MWCLLGFKDISYGRIQHTDAQIDKGRTLLLLTALNKRKLQDRARERRRPVDKAPVGCSPEEQLPYGNWCGVDWGAVQPMPGPAVGWLV